MSTKRVLNIFLYILLLFSLVLLLLFYFGKKTEDGVPVVTNFALSWGYFLLISAAVLTIGFTIVQIASNKKVLIKALASVVILGVVVLVASFIASGDPLVSLEGKEIDAATNSSVLKWVGTGLNTMYLLLGIAVVSIIYNGLSKYLK